MRQNIYRNISEYMRFCRVCVLGEECRDAVDGQQIVGGGLAEMPRCDSLRHFPYSGMEGAFCRWNFSKLGFFGFFVPRNPKNPKIVIVLYLGF